MEELRKSGVIEDYSLTQTTLDEVKPYPLLTKQSVVQFNLFLGVCAVCKQTNRVTSGWIPANIFKRENFTKTKEH